MGEGLVRRTSFGEMRIRSEAVQKVFNVILNEVKNPILFLNREILSASGGLRSIRMTVLKLFGQPGLVRRIFFGEMRVRSLLPLGEGLGMRAYSVIISDAALRGRRFQLANGYCIAHVDFSSAKHARKYSFARHDAVTRFIKNRALVMTLFSDLRDL